MSSAQIIRPGWLSCFHVCGCDKMTLTKAVQGRGEGLSWLMIVIPLPWKSGQKWKLSLHRPEQREKGMGAHGGLASITLTLSRPLVKWSHPQSEQVFHLTLIKAIPHPPLLTRMCLTPTRHVQRPNNSSFRLLSSDLRWLCEIGTYRYTVFFIKTLSSYLSHNLLDTRLTLWCCSQT